MAGDLEEKRRIIEALGFAADFAGMLTHDRTLAQIRHWAALSQDKSSPVSYFKALHRKNEAVKDAVEIKRDVAAALAESADPSREERRRRRDRVYLTLTRPDHPWREDTQETRESLLVEFGFHAIAANDMARRNSLAEIIQWIDASEGEAQPWVFVRQQLTWGLCEPAWPTDCGPQQKGEMALIRQWDALVTWLRLPDGRVVAHRPCPPGWERHTERLREILGREPWSDYSGEGGIEMRIGFGVFRPSEEPPPLKPAMNAADRARERVKAILDAQQRESETERSVRALRENEMIDDPFASEPVR